MTRTARNAAATAITTESAAKDVSSSTTWATARLNATMTRKQPNANQLSEGTWENTTESRNVAASNAMEGCKKSVLVGRASRSTPRAARKTNEAAKSVRYSHGHARS